MWCLRCSNGYTWARLGNWHKSNAHLEVKLKFAFGRNKKGKAFGILSQLKKIIKSNDAHAQNKMFLSST